MELKEVISRLDNYIGEELYYKQIAELLEVQYYKGGNGKARQLNEIQQYYKLEKVKTKYKIISKYDTPIPLIDNRQSIYYDDLEIIILYALQNSKHEHNIWSVTKSLVVTSLVNNNYTLGKKDLQLTADSLEVEIEYLNTFYQSIHSRFKSVFESTLKRMSNKKLIDYKEITMLYKSIAKIKTNELGIPVMDDEGHIEYKTDRIHTEATATERQYILKVEKKILKDMGYNTVSELIKSGKYNNYKNEVNKIITKDLNIEYYYKAYDIVHNDNDIQEVVNELKEMFARNSLNMIKLDALDKSKDKLLNKDLENKAICIEMLVNNYPIVDLKTLIKNYLTALKTKETEQDNEDNLPF